MPVEHGLELRSAERGERGGGVGGGPEAQEGASAVDALHAEGDGRLVGVASEALHVGAHDPLLKLGHFIPHAGEVPAREVAVEGRGLPKHVVHRGHVGHVPLAEVAVEGRGLVIL